MHMLRPIALLVGSFALALASHAWAGSVYLNGVSIDGVTNQTFENCKVVIDAQGNIFITAKGYQVQAVGGQTPTATPAAAAGGPVSMHYWLVTEKSSPGMTQYDMDVYINNKFVRRIPSTEGQIVMDVTKFLVQGANKVYIIAKKNMTAGRRSSSPQHYDRLIIGEGAPSDGTNVFIDREVFSYKRTAAETQDFNDVVNVTAR